MIPCALGWLGLVVGLASCDAPSGPADAPMASDASSVDSASVDAMADDDAGARDGGSGEPDAGSFDAPLALDAALGDAGRDAPIDAGPTSVVRTYRVWLWNVAGNLVHSGDTDTGLIAAAASSIVNRDADFVAFNELCRSQYRALQDALIARGWPADETNFARFSASRPGGTSICNGTEYGNAIFSRRPFGAAENFTLPSDGSAEDRTMLCAPLASLPHMRFCTTHITTSNAPAPDGVAHNIRQLRAVLNQIEDYWRAGDTVLIGGDFNAQPDYARLDRFYARSLDVPNNRDNVGHYRELDDDDGAHCRGYGEVTVDGPPTGGPCGEGSKIDLIFVREDRLAGAYSADSLAISTACGGACSDHRILFGEVRIRVQE
jgi:endonuclease/exonuclease/phosphatase family metal-dependent hydrolase